MTTEYRPIACGAYDEIEVLAMQRARVRCVYVDKHEAERHIEGQVVNTAIHDAAEFLVLRVGEERLEIRLDRILQIDDKDTGERWRQKTD